MSTMLRILLVLGSLAVVSGIPVFSDALSANPSLFSSQLSNPNTISLSPELLTELKMGLVDCDTLNISDPVCLSDCYNYYNISWLANSIVNDGFTSEAFHYLQLRSMSGSPLGYQDDGNPDMCGYVYGTYCYTPLVMNNDVFVAMTHGCCIPGSCTGDDAVAVVKANNWCYGAFVASYGSMYADAAEIRVQCEILPRHWRADTIIIIAIFFIFLVIVAATSILRQWSVSCKHKPFAVITSVKGNNANIYQKMTDSQMGAEAGVKGSVAPPPTERPRMGATEIITKIFCIQDTWAVFLKIRPKKDFAFLDGIRWWSMCWVVLGHAYMQAYYSTLENGPCVMPLAADSRDDYDYKIHDFYTTFPMQGFYSVDSFFWLSGFLAGMSLIKVCQKYEMSRAAFWIPFVYLARYIRLAPMMIYVTFLQWYVQDQIPWGPHVLSRDVNRDICEDKWPGVFFLYANLMGRPREANCMGHLWYIQDDFQMFIVAPFVVMLFLYRRSYGFAACALIFAVCCGVRLYQGIYYHFGGLVIPNPDISIRHGGDQFSDAYVKPYSRMATYYAGMFGYFLIYVTPSKMVLPRHWYWLLQTLAAFTLMALAFWPFEDTEDSPNYRWGLTRNTIFFAFSRPFWGVGLSIFAYALRFNESRNADGTTNGENPSLIKYLLSADIYQPLAKLTYTMYLVHQSIYAWYNANMTRAFHFSPWEITSYWIIILVTTFTLALILWVTMETPMGNITLLILSLLTIPAIKESASQPYDPRAASLHKMDRKDSIVSDVAQPGIPGDMIDTAENSEGIGQSPADTTQEYDSQPNLLAVDSEIETNTDSFNDQSDLDKLP